MIGQKSVSGKMWRFNGISRVFVLGVMVAMLGPAVVPAAETASPETPAMTAEQRQLADTMTRFMVDTETKFFDTVERFNGNLNIETGEFNDDLAKHTVKVSRGDMIEKAGWYVSLQKKGVPPYVPDPLYSRYMEIDVHAATPHVGMLHATMYFTVLKNGVGMLAGYMDYVPAVVHENDNQRLKLAMDQVFTKHGQDIGRFRAELCESEFGARHHRDNLKAACVGASLYARPMMEVTAENLALVMEAYTAFVGTYFDILEERKNQAVAAEDTQALDAMRKRWLEDQMFADTFSKKVVPYEVWSMANLPPTVKF